MNIICGEIQIEAGLRIDILVADCVIVELKAVEEMKPLFEAQSFSVIFVPSCLSG